ncbi:unnamed protein product [Hyaloperonospora brassicae]|uniref:Uncharacterized protein n=1 Tax=Hyaloperonospora brassicae TaxID=162125 RepID=A0AAV0V3V7_HYABA|nr:unnamed protein product [Hyaloperonospora brassicae]
MSKVSTFVRKLFRKDDRDDRGVHLRLRRAVAAGKARQVAVLLEKGACPIWMDDDAHSRRRFRRRHSDPCQLNALLLACRLGNVEVLSLLLGAFFAEPQVLAHFSRAMYCLVIRYGHWNAFQRLQQRRVPMTSVSSASSIDSIDSRASGASSRLLSAAAMEHSSSKLPMPVFVAAGHGRHHILSLLLDRCPQDWAHYSFEGYSLLTVATINGHYECVRVLLDRQVASGKTIDAAVAAARRYRQAHILVLLTSRLPEFTSDSEPGTSGEKICSSTTTTTTTTTTHNNNVSDLMGYRLKASRYASSLLRGRASIAETVASDFDDDGRRSSLLSVSSPVNYNQSLDHVEEMRIRAEMAREQQQIGLKWLFDGRGPAAGEPRRVDPHGLSAGSIRVLTSAREGAPSSNDSSSSCQEDVSWYAVKSSDKSLQQLDDLLTSEEEEEEEEEEEVETYYESMFLVHEDEVTETSDELPPLFEEAHVPVTTAQSSGVQRSERSRKVISIRSRGKQNRLLTAIEENFAGETEA